ncbi:MAG: hypothetical protein AAF217_10160 [Pseudomonadota bacterium]
MGGGDKQSGEPEVATSESQNPIESSTQETKSSAESTSSEQSETTAQSEQSETAEQAQQSETTEQAQQSETTQQSQAAEEPQETETTEQSQQASNSTYVPQNADELTTNEQIVEGKKLTVLSKQTKAEEETIVIASQETQREDASIKVQEAATLLTLQFSEFNTIIDEASAMRIESFVEEKSFLDKEATLTIWAYTGSSSGSVSEAKRLAYYRALSARNELINNGFSKEKIGVEIRFGESQLTYDTVQIVVN